MRRAVLTLGGTVAGIAAIVAFKYQPAASSAAAAGLSAPGALGGTVSGGTVSGGAVSGGTATPPAPSATSSAAARPSGTAKPSPKPSASSGTGNTGTGGGTGQSTAARVITGAVANTQYGPMQVQITVSGTRMTKVTVVQETDAGGPSGSIDAMAIPQLNQEALSAQSANIDAVSGASYTSAGYKQSLQSAIDMAGL